MRLTMPPQSRSYWQQRSEERVISAERQVQRLQSTLDREMLAAVRNIEAAISRLYQRYGDVNGMDYGDAVKYLTDADRSEFQGDVNDYIAWMKDARYRSQNYSRLHALSTRARVQVLEAKKASIMMEGGKLYSRLGSQVEQTLWDVYDDTRSRTAFDNFKGTGVGVEFGKANPRVFQALLANPWSGSDFSSKIWNLEEGFVQSLEGVLVRGLIQGQSIDEMTRNLHAAGLGNPDGRGGQRWQAERLVRTEANYILNQATEDAYEDMGVDRYQYLATLDDRTSEMCQELDGQVFPTKDAIPGVNYPPMHPWCRSTTIPYFEDLGGERIARGADGKTYYVPGDMTYAQWKAGLEAVILITGSNGDQTPIYSTKAADIIAKQEPVNPELLIRVKRAYEAQGGIIEQSEEWDQILTSQGKEAFVMFTGFGELPIIVLHSRVSASGLFEELIHTAQMADGRLTPDVLNDEKRYSIMREEMEVEAKEKLLHHRLAYGITSFEVEVLTEGLESHKIALAKLLDEKEG